jgi:hypothetical protein
MKEEIKHITVNGIKYEFWFDERLNMWRILENRSLVDYYAIDVEIDLAHSGGIIDWDQIADFIEFITSSRQIVNDNITGAQFVLGSLFKTIYKGAFDDNFFNDVVFNLSGIDYKGLCKNINLKNSFEYDFFFFPQFKKNINEDISTYVWRANFRDTLLLGVYCDRI